MSTYYDDDQIIENAKPYPSLYEEEFLKELDLSSERTTFAKVITLDRQENPLEQVEGKVTSGSINIDGNSAVRRTCSITMITEDVNISDYYWGLNTKFRLEIGLKNTVSYAGHYDYYPDIIWFKMGTFIITSLNTTLNASSFTIQLQGKDKMCLLNGDVGGVINATTDFGTYDYYDASTGLTTNHKLPIKQIIIDSVHAYANEPLHNIVVNDLDELGLELLEYKYDRPLYLIRDAASDEYQMITLDGNTSVRVRSSNSDNNYSRTTTLSNLSVYDNLTSSLLGDESTPTEFKIGSYANPCVAAKITYGQTAGYRTCELVYAGDLISNVGDSLTSMLDKIKSMLGEFEYFYDIDGRFIFQRKRCLVNTVWTPINKTDSETYVQALALASNCVYDFTGSVLISSFQNTPNLLNLKNDFTVWGERKGISGSAIPIHMRYAIDNKPFRYITYDNVALTSLTRNEIAEREELKIEHYKTWDLDDLARSLRRNRLNDALISYPAIAEVNTEYKKYNPWWEVIDWAHYYKILLGQFPGNRHPDDEMYYYCQMGPGREIVEAYTNFLCKDPLSPIGSQQNPRIFGSANYNTNMCELFFYKNPSNGEYYVQIGAHGGCVHTYEQFLDVELYVNYPDGNGNHLTEQMLDLDGDGVAETHYTWQGIYYNKTSIDNAIARGLYHYLVFVYDPKIPEDVRSQLDKISITDQWVDPYLDSAENSYIYGVDWRELIYRMALDYRRHNHDDDFEVILAQRNFPLYQTGITGYEQYYTDLEGFWRQLYNLPLTSKEQTSALSYDYTYYRNLDQEKVRTMPESVFIKGCYKPIGQQVKGVPEEKVPAAMKNVYYFHDTEEDKWYLKDADLYYYYSDDNGFTFKSSVGGRAWPIKGSNIIATQFVNYAKQGKIFTREIPDITSLYIYKYNGMYKLLDTIDYTANNHTFGGETFSTRFFQKINDESSLSGIDWRLVNEETGKLSFDEKVHLYTSSNYTEYRNLSNSLNSASEIYYNTLARLKESSGSVTSADVNTAYENMAALQQSLAVLENNMHYVSVTEYFQNFAKTSSVKENLLNNAFVYNENDLCCLKHIRNNNILTNIYGANNTNAVESLEVFTLSNQGTKTVSSTKQGITYYTTSTKFYGDNEENAHWNSEVFTAPYTLNFWFDFLEGDNELRQYTTQAVGDRPKAVKETTVKSIYYRDTPKIIFSTQEKFDLEDHKTGYNYMILPDNSSYENMFSISAQGIDAKNRVDELLYQHSYCTESVQVSAIPIYYLDVNKRIHVYDPNTGINGDYVVSRLSYSLTYNGMMTITATKAPENSVTEREA